MTVFAKLNEQKEVDDNGNSRPIKVISNLELMRRRRLGGKPDLGF